MEHESKQYTEKRRYFRVTYPYNASPKICIYGKSYRVVNVSEGGLFCEIPGPQSPLFRFQKSIRGTIVFRDKQSYHFEARIVHCPDGGMALQFKNLLPYAWVVKEQLYLRRHYFDRELMASRT